MIDLFQGALGDQSMLRSRLKILANDDPYGVYVISSINRPIRVNETNSGEYEAAYRVLSNRSPVFGM